MALSPVARGPSSAWLGPQVDMGGRVARVAGRVCTPLFPVVPGTQWRPRECV